MNLIHKYVYKNREIKPDMSLTRLTDVTHFDIKRLGARVAAIDLDNTSVLYGSYKVSPEAMQWVENMKRNGIDVVVITNTVFFRGHYISKQLGASCCYAFSIKPLTFAIKKCAKKLGVDISQIVMIGDTLTTDILSANASGAKSIKVEPLAQLLKAERIISLINNAK